MKALKFGILFTFFAIFGWSSIATFGQNLTETYCNYRFDFCVEYPAELLPLKEKSANNDGIKMWSKDGNLKVSISGYHNVFNSSLKEEYELFIAAIEDIEGPIDKRKVVLVDDQFEVTLEVGQKKIFHKTSLQNGQFHGLTIETNIKGFDLPEHNLDVLKDQIRFSENL